MPELPEVETVRRTLEPALLGKKIMEAEVFCCSYLRGCNDETLGRLLPRSRFRRLARHGKYLYLILDSLELEVHLGMTGRLLVCARDQELVKHTHVRFGLEEGQDLRFIDPRRFGHLGIKPLGMARERRSLLGMEPLTPEFTWKNLGRALKGRKAPIKALLLEQKLVAGLGNIYADEALFRARIHPEQTGGELGESALKNLHRAINDLIGEAVAAGGTSFSDYVDATGQRGEFFERLSVYGRENQPCPYCGTPIKRLKLRGRSTCYCPRCQPQS